MRLALYSLAVSFAYALLWVAAPGLADATVIAFVALLLVPAIIFEGRRRRH